MTTRRIRITRHDVVKGRDLIPNPRNWRRHPPEQRDATTAVLDRLGYVDELKVVETPEGLMLMDGHLRAAIGAEDDVPIAIVDLNDEEQAVFLATFDPLAAMAVTDQVLFNSLAETLASEGDVVQRLLAGVRNHDAPLLLGDKLEEDEGAAARAAKKIAGEGYVAMTEPGQVWKLGRHRLFCGDAADVSNITDGIDLALTLTDPPYGIGIVRGVGTEQAGHQAKPFGRQKRGRVGTAGRSTGSMEGVVRAGEVQPRVYMVVTGDDKRFDPRPLLTVGRNQIIFGGGYFGQHLPEGTTWLAWDKGVGSEATFSGFELAWTSFRGRYRLYRHTWSGMVRAGSRDVELADRVHPTQKPVAVLEAILQDFSKPGDAICDPYIGSGSTLIACERTDRTCYAVEIEAPYCDVVIQRWEAYTGQKAERQD